MFCGKWWCVPPGVHAVKLEEVERRLRNDLMHEAMAWGGRLLLHRDVSVKKPAGQTVGASSHGMMLSDEDDITQNDELMPDNNAITAFWDSTGKLPLASQHREGFLLTFRDLFWPIFGGWDTCLHRCDGDGGDAQAI